MYLINLAAIACRKNYIIFKIRIFMEETKEILDKLRKIEIEIEFIKERMPNKDMFLDSEEKVLLEESYENEKKGILVSAKEARKQLGI